MLPLNHELFLKKLKDNNIDYIIPIDEYKNFRTKLKFKCLKCNHVWSIRPDKLFYENRRKCPNCDPWKHGEKMSQEKYISKINKKLNNINSNVKLIKILSEKNRGVDKQLFQCTTCNLIYKTTVSITAHQHSNCPRCSRQKQRKLEFGDTYKIYKNNCRKICRYTILDYALFKNDNKPIGKYKFHIDHIIPISFCFDNNIPEYITSNPANLRKLWWKNNIKKSNKFNISNDTMKTILMDKYYGWLSIYPDYEFKYLHLSCI